MKVTESVTRECCHFLFDLRPYKGNPVKDCSNQKVHFCVHCGQLWRWHRAPGEMDGGMERMTILTTEP